MNPRLLSLVALVLSALFVTASRAASSEQIARLEKRLENGVADGKLLSAAGAIIDNGNVKPLSFGVLDPAWNKAPDRSTRYQIGSVTKVFTNLLLGEMVARGQVGYDTTVAELIGERLEFANPAVGEITLLELATHTSGLPRLPANLSPTDTVDPYADYGEQALLDALASARARQPLGDHYAYSNFGHGLLGYLLGQKHGGGYRAALEQIVLEPLALEQTGFEPGGDTASGYSGDRVVPPWHFKVLAGAGALWSTVADLTRLARIQLGQLDNPLAHKLAVDRKIVDPDAGPYAVSRVWHVGDTPAGKVYWHNGETAGFRSALAFRPATGDAIVLVVAGDLDPAKLARAWLAMPAPTETPADQAFDGDILGQYQLTSDIGVGVYKGQSGLVAQLSGQPSAPIHAVGEDWYAISVVDASLRFVRKDGEVVALELVQNGAVQRARKVADRAEVLSRRSVEVDPATLDDYIGVYKLGPQARFTIRRAENGLEARLTGQPFFPIYPEGDDVFFYKVVDAELHFERAESGEIRALVLHQGGTQRRAKRVE